MSVRGIVSQYVGSYFLIFTRPIREVSKIIWVDKTFVPERKCHPVEVWDEGAYLPRLACSECGEPLKYRELPEDYVLMPYCASCGAKVVE